MILLECGIGGASTSDIENIKQATYTRTIDDDAYLNALMKMYDYEDRIRASQTTPNWKGICELVAE